MDRRDAEIAQSLCVPVLGLPDFSILRTVYMTKNTYIGATDALLLQAWISSNILYASCRAENKGSAPQC